MPRGLTTVGPWTVPFDFVIVVPSSIFVGHGGDDGDDDDDEEELDPFPV